MGGHRILVSVVSVLGLLFLNAAASAATVSWDQRPPVVAPGDSFTEVIVLDDTADLAAQLPSGIEALQLEALWDPAALTFVEARPGSGYDGSLGLDVLVNDLVAGRVVVLLDTVIAPDVTDDYELLELDFTLSPSASSALIDWELDLQEETAVFGELGPDPTDVAVSLVPVPPAVLLLGSALLGLVGLRRTGRRSL